MKERKGERKPRSATLSVRKPALGYYCIVTDTKETEKNYLEGLRDSLPASIRDKLVIKVSTAKTSNLVEEAKEQVNLHPQFCEPWIVFDRDRVPNFNEIIDDAIKANINPGWSNPCVEIWLQAYYGTMPNYPDSVACWKGFASVYKAKTKQEYDKAEKALYRKLCETGDEQKAIAIARQRFEQHKRDGRCKPTEMWATTTLFLLLDEIRKKVNSDH